MSVQTTPPLEAEDKSDNKRESTNSQKLRKFCVDCFKEAMGNLVAKGIIVLFLLIVGFFAIGGGGGAQQAPSWLKPANQVIAKNSVSMSQYTEWSWADIVFQPNQALTGFKVHNHPDGAFEFKFTQEAMNMSDVNQAPRHFEVFCADHETKIGDGELLFQRNFYVFQISFDDAPELGKSGASEIVLWARADLDRRDLSKNEAKKSLDQNQT